MTDAGVWVFIAPCSPIPSSRNGVSITDLYGIRLLTTEPPEAPFSRRDSLSNIQVRNSISIGSDAQSQKSRVARLIRSRQFLAELYRNYINHPSWPYGFSSLLEDVIFWTSEKVGNTKCPKGPDQKCRVAHPF